MENYLLLINQPVATIISALISALFGIVIGTYVGHILTKSRERKKTQYESALNHLKAQIEELYGPLAGMIEESESIYSLACKILPTKKISDEKQKIVVESFSGGDHNKWCFIMEEYWIPLHKRIIELIRSKIYLLEEKELPKSYYSFLVHSIGFEILHRLAREKNEPTNKEVKDIGWPAQFSEDVHETLAKLRTCLGNCREKLDKEDNNFLTF